MKILKDKITKTISSKDSSILEITPYGVFYPKNNNDIKKIISYAKKNKLSLHPRGEATSTCGQSLGSGIVINFPRHMNKIIKITKDYADVESGVILSTLNNKLKKHKKTMPVDPSSADVITIGGMVSNNSSGIHSYLYGDMKDYVIGLEGFLTNGSFFSTITNKGLNEIKKKLKNIKEKAKALESKLPKTNKSSFGYNIKDGLIKKIDINKLIAGSEGTLCVLTKIRLKIIDIPKHRLTVFSQFKTFSNALKVVNEVKKIKHISATELSDETLIKANIASFPEAKKFFNPKTCASILFEIDGSSLNIVNSDLKKLEKILKEYSLDYIVTNDEKEKKWLWWIRKAASPILSQVIDGSRTLRFIEDVAIPLDKVKEFYLKEKEILKKYNLKTAFFGHIGRGHFHINPRLNGRDKDFIKNLNKISEETFMLAKSLNGTISAEHGDGIIRSKYIKKLYPSLYKLFLDIKNIFDKNNILNPDITNTIKIKDDTLFRYKDIKNLDKNLSEEILNCSGCNDCINFCKSYKKTKNEANKTRGRAYIIKEIFSKNLNKLEIKKARKHIESCKLCLNCIDKCPANYTPIKLSSILREKGIIKLSFSKKLLMTLFTPIKNLLLYYLKFKKDRKLNLKAFSYIFKLGLYFHPYLQKLDKVILNNNIKIYKNSKYIKAYLKFYNLHF
jgi:FAD/FMN-containing dehydrogenase/NAD-dependent dihydropyrimidine dehydrogenase PreA subunit